MSRVNSIKYEIRFREDHTSPSGEPCDELIIMLIDHSTLIKAGEKVTTRFSRDRGDPMKVLPKVVCKCGSELPITLWHWQHKIESTVGKLRGSVKDLAIVASTFAIEERAKNLWKEIKDYMPKDHWMSSEQAVRSHITHTMLQATDIAREQVGQAVARVF